MAKPRTIEGSKIRFPYIFQKNDPALKIETWLGTRLDEADGSPWSVKTRSSVGGVTG